ncbi:alpha/beta hydrolase [Pigmentiphaga humi]|nr:alpha/beta hydrolase [Pigmentiphaga humi]
MQVVVDLPALPPTGLAVVTHPQPLLGGSAMHKLPHFLARALSGEGWLAARPNFRGVGQSAGTHDEGRGESDDTLALCQALRAGYPGLPLLLVGFSFGAYVHALVARRLADRGEPAWRTFLAGMPYGLVPAGRSYGTPRGLPDAWVVHGEQDEVVPVANVFDWARPDAQPVVVVPGADHFFTGKLPLLRDMLLAHAGIKVR